MKKIFLLNIIIVISIFCFGCTTPEKTEYYNDITQLEETIDNLEYQLELLKRENQIIKNQINSLSNQLDEKFTKEEMYEWAHICNRDGMRANMKLIVEHKKYFLGIPIDTKSYTVSGVLIKTNKNKLYVLTTSSVLETIDGYSKKKCKLTDAFNVTYDGTIVTYDSNYNLGLIEISSQHDHLYSVKLSSSNPSVNDPICNIFYNIKGPVNSMNFTRIDRYINEDLGFSLIYNTATIYDSIYGGMSLDINGNLCGLIIYTYSSTSCVSSVPVSQIRSFLNQNGISA